MPSRGDDGITAAVTEAVTRHCAPLPYAGACFNPSARRGNSQVSAKFRCVEQLEAKALKRVTF